MLVTGLPPRLGIVSGMTSSPDAFLLQLVTLTFPSVVVQDRSAKLAAWSGRNAQAKSARRAWSSFMMRQFYHMLGGRGNLKPESGS